METYYDKFSFNLPNTPRTRRNNKECPRTTSGGKITQIERRVCAVLGIYDKEGTPRSKAFRIK